MTASLPGAVALVAGGTRGGGRGIAVELGAAGATVYVTGRSTRHGTSDLGRPETIEETAEQVDAAGGRGIAIRCDHSDPEQVEALVARIAREQRGRLDILVNDVWGGDHLVRWGPLWEHPLGDGLTLLHRALDTHLITSHHALPLMVARRTGLVVEVTDGDEATNALFPHGYRGVPSSTSPRAASSAWLASRPPSCDTTASPPSRSLPAACAPRRSSTTSASPRPPGAMQSIETSTSRTPRPRRSWAVPSPPWPATPTSSPRPAAR